MGDFKRPDNLYQRMLGISSEIQTVAKNLSVGDGKFSYKAVGEGDVLQAVKPLEAKWGVYSYPARREVIQTDVMVSESTTYKGEAKKTSKLFMRVETVYRFVNVDNPAEFLEITTYGDGVDPQDKAPGKAMTYGDKYALLKAYKIMTGEDPDQNASEPLSSMSRSYGPVTIGRAKADALQKKLEALNVNIPVLLQQYGVERLEDLTPGMNTRIEGMIARGSTGKN